MYRDDQELLTPKTVALEPNSYQQLAAAIRKGCLLLPRQTFGAFHNRDDGACAIGAAMTALDVTSLLDLRARCGMRAKLPLRCPADDQCGSDNVLSVVMHLNDAHEWKREQIADWLETLP